MLHLLGTEVVYTEPERHLDKSFVVFSWTKNQSRFIQIYDSRQDTDVKIPFHVLEDVIKTLTGFNKEPDFDNK